MKASAAHVSATIAPPIDDLNKLKAIARKNVPITKSTIATIFLMVFILIPHFISSSDTISKEYIWSSEFIISTPENALNALTQAQEQNLHYTG